MKTMMQNKIKRIAALFLVAVMCLGIAAPYMAAPEDDSIYISTAEDLIEISKNCAYDKWSEGKTIVLSNDISLKDVEFEQIPYFAGTFDGQGYTIFDYEIDQKLYPAGLFGVVKQGAVIKNLKVTGSVIPEGDKESVGGIAGVNNGTLQNIRFSGVVSGEVAVGGIVGLNKETGVIENALVQGSIFGEHGTGGIAGRNLGTITSCENEAFVNNASVDSTVSLEDINTNLLQSLYSINSSDMMNAFTDTGGIAGYSSGMILASRNEGIIGYPRMGYNAGGIVGRNSGYVQACANEGEVLGRKDIGGIVGQVEPFVDVEIDPTDLVAIDEQLHTLKNLVDKTGNSAEKTKNDVEVHLDKIREYIDDIATALEVLGIEEPEEDAELPEIEDGDFDLPESEDELPENQDWPELGEDTDLSNEVDWDEIESEVSTAKGAITDISTALRGINEELGLADEKASAGTNEVADGLEAINNQLSTLSDSIINMIDNVKSLTADDIIQDTSNEDIEAVIYGKITDCVNEGTIEGDYNVGGIAGIMSIEYELDPEDDTSMDISWEERKQYEVKTIVTKCINEGKVTAKKDNIGGICGQVDIGVITNCLAYGSVTSEDGDYVGGIAGVANTTISNCIANCGLSGVDYVGGIIGCGLTEEEHGSTVSNNYSLVKISDCEQFKGAIAGGEDGTFKNNYFVSNELQGINRISYEGKAQPITYEELLQIPNLPDKLKGFTLSFVAEDNVIKSIDFNYGDSFGADIFPEIPKKDGYDGVWDITDLSNLCFDTVVTAEYTLYVTAIKSDVVRENGRPVFIVKGDFSGEDSVIAIKGEITEELQEELGVKVDIAEYWKVSFSDDGQKRHSIRFLPAENLENARLYIKENGEWKKVETEEYGSYKAFQVVGNEAELLVMPIRYEVMGYAFLAIVVVALVVGLILLGAKTNLLSKLKTKIGVKKIVISFIVLGVIGSVASVAYVAMLPQVCISAELAAISTDVISAKNQSMKLDLTADIGSNHVELDSNLYVLDEDNKSLIVLEENNRKIYYVNEMVFFENGKAFRVGEEKSSDDSLAEQIRKLYEATKITRTEQLDQVIYAITTADEDAQELMEVLIPSSEGQIATVGNTEIRIIATDGILERVEIMGNATLKDAMETEVTVSAVLSDFTEVKEGEYQIPTEVKAAIKDTEKESLSNIEEEMYRLLLAWVEFNGDEKDGTVKIDVSCGPINLDTEYDWSDVSHGISDASNIEKLPDLVYEACMNGDFSCEKLGDSYIFQLELDENAMKELAETIAPEIQTQMVNLKEGIVEVIIENNEVVAFEISMDGKVSVLLSEVDASVEAEFTFE